MGIFVNVQAQLYPGLAGVQYSMGSTMGDTKNFVSDLSWTGFAVEYDKFISRNLTIGFLTGWNAFDELQRGSTIELEGSTLTGTQIRYFSSFPVLANFSYFFGHKKSTRNFSLMLLWIKVIDFNYCRIYTPRIWFYPYMPGILDFCL